MQLELKGLKWMLPVGKFRVVWRIRVANTGSSRHMTSPSPIYEPKGTVVLTLEGVASELNSWISMGPIPMLMIFEYAALENELERAEHRDAVREPKTVLIPILLWSS